MVFLILTVLFVASMVCGYFLQIWLEKRKWNNGISPYDGSRWEHFETDFDGSRHYRDKSGNVIWID